MPAVLDAPPPVARRPSGGARCYYRPAVLVAAGLVLVGSFWFASRYPSLLGKYAHVHDAATSMAFGKAVWVVAADAPVWERIAATTVNWLDGMKIGMSFGVLLGALLHTVLKYYPLRLGGNMSLNSVKGALVGVPAGVCANCSVPVACGVTRGAGRVEAALGFLFSSPNFNPVVVVMSIAALPVGVLAAKYLVLLAVITLVVPLLVRWAERAAPAGLADQAACAIDLSGGPCRQSLGEVLAELGREYAVNVWALLRPTAVIMLTASLLAAVALVLVPWDDLLAERTPLRVALVSLLSTAMPVPIALDVIFAGNLHARGVPTGYVATFALTLGTYSLIPSVYLWREVSKRLSVALFLVFWAIGFVAGMVF